jgi:hypothetical protein
MLPHLETYFHFERAELSSTYKWLK